MNILVKILEKMINECDRIMAKEMDKFLIKKDTWGTVLVKIDYKSKKETWNGKFYNE